MSIIYREEKGAPLTAQELDGNFHDLDERIKALERQSPDRKIHEIKFQGDWVVIYDNAGQVVSQTKMPLISLNPKGQWQETQAYVRNDLIAYQGITYICSKSHSPSAFSAENWQKLYEEKHD